MTTKRSTKKTTRSAARKAVKGATKSATKRDRRVFADDEKLKVLKNDFKPKSLRWKAVEAAKNSTVGKYRTKMGDKAHYLSWVIRNKMVAVVTR
jgi:hypothetical protein